MKKKFKLGIIGCGFMGQSILDQIVMSEYVRHTKIIASDKIQSRFDDVDYLGVNTTLDNRYVAENSEYLILAVKPKDFEIVAKDLEGVRPDKVISIMLGVTKNTIKNALGVGVRVARCIPNISCSMGCGAVAIDINDFNKSLDDIQFITMLLAKLGRVISLDESKMNSAMGIVGSASSYVFLLIDSLVESGVKRGLTKNEALNLAINTVVGASELVANAEDNLSQLIMTACNANSATLSAVKSLESDGFSQIIDNAVESSVKRITEITK